MGVLFVCFVIIKAMLWLVYHAKMMPKQQNNGFCFSKTRLLKTPNILTKQGLYLFSVLQQMLKKNKKQLHYQSVCLTYFRLYLLFNTSEDK